MSRPNLPLTRIQRHVLALLLSGPLDADRFHFHCGSETPAVMLSHATAKLKRELGPDSITKAPGHGTPYVLTDAGRARCAEVYGQS